MRGTRKYAIDEENKHIKILSPYLMLNTTYLTIIGSVIVSPSLFLFVVSLQLQRYQTKHCNCFVFIIFYIPPQISAKY